MRRNARNVVARAVMIGGALSLLVIVTGAYVYNSFWGRAVLGISTVVVANDSGSELRNVRVSLWASPSGPINRTFDAIAPGESQAIRVRTSDLFVHRLDYAIEDEECSYAEGGIACRGERFIISIKGPRHVTTGYGRP